MPQVLAGLKPRQYLRVLPWAGYSIWALVTCEKPVPRSCT
jgi:hypothetical protein